MVNTGDEMPRPDHPPSGGWLCRDCDAHGSVPAGPVRRCAACGGSRIVQHAELFSLALGHVDADAFFAAVEKRDCPALRDQPVIIGGGRRGVVATACYIARTYGVRSAMPMFEARRLCPAAVIVPPRMAAYVEAARAIRARLTALSPLVGVISIDEACIDLSGTALLHGAAPAIVLARVGRQIETEIGLSLSIGLSYNRFLAKMASEFDKPRGFAVIGRAEARALLAPRPLRDLPGVGPETAKRLERLGLRRIADVQAADPALLARQLGGLGLTLSRLAQGEDARKVRPGRAARSISAETTLFADTAAAATLIDHLHALCDRVAMRARTAEIVGDVVTLKLKDSDFDIRTRRQTLATPTASMSAIRHVATALLTAAVAEAPGRPYRLIGVSLSGLTRATASDLSTASDLFAAPETARTQRRETAIIELRDRFGQSAIGTVRDLRSQRRDRPKE